MIDRYSYPEMASLWSEENKFKKWLEVEVAVLEAWSQIGKIPLEAVKTIKEKASFNVSRINEIEKEVNHDLIAFLTNLAENIGPHSRFVHLGLTSSDVVDSALSLLMREAMDILIVDEKNLINLLKEKAKEYKDTVMVGRTHGMHAEPITFGLKLALWHEESKRNLKRLEDAKEIISYGKISGVVGTYANIDPHIEKLVCEKLNLKPAPLSSQILQRDRHAQYLMAIALAGASIEKFTTEIRSLARTEIGEVEEPFGKKQKGSSAMPHKKNPITCERLCGLARLLRSNGLAAIENIALWHERDISHSSVERIIIPDSTILLDYMLKTFIKIIEGMMVNAQRMKENLENFSGSFYSQRILLSLVEKGLPREEAYSMVQELALKSLKEKAPFKNLVSQDQRIQRHIKAKELEELFDLKYYLRYVDEIFLRLF